MPEYTPNYQLPYPAPGDSPCSLSDTTCAFGDAVDTQLDALQAIVDRTAGSVPMAVVSTVGLKQYIIDPNSTGFNYNVTFDSVLVDTDGMTDLVSNPQGFTIQTPGIYLRWIYFTMRTTWPSPGTTIIGPSIRTPTAQGTGPNQTILLNIIPSSTAMPIQNDRNRLYNVATSSNQIMDMQVNWSPYLFFSPTIGGATAFPAYITAQMGVVWLREAP